MSNTNQSVAALIARVQSWKQSLVSAHLCLDLRSPSAYKRRHFVPSTNIPWSQLSLRCAELPPKSVPFAVVEPTGQTTGSCIAWLQQHGWQCPWVFHEDELLNDTFWVDACRQGWAQDLEKSIIPNNRAWPGKPWLLFQPCPFLANQIDRIEQSLSNSKPPGTLLKCLDIGCGSGRDVAWLLSRPLSRWKVYAIDSLRGAVERTAALASNMGVDDRLTVTQAKITAEGSWKTLDGSSSNNNEELSTTAPQDKRVRFSPGIPTEAFFSRLLGSEQKFDMILTIRFLVRALLPQLPSLLNVGGFLVISHFVEDGVHQYDQPRMDHRLRLGELAELFSAMPGTEVIVDIIEEIEDGRPVNSVIVQNTHW